MNKQIEYENVLLAHFLDARADLFEHIGLPPNASWGEFRQHYAKGEGVDIERAAYDLATLPAVMARVACLKSQMRARFD